MLKAFMRVDLRALCPLAGDPHRERPRVVSYVASKPIGPGSEGEWLRRLADVGRELTSELDQSVVLDRVLESAREITGARYAAIGILNEEKNRLAQFLTAGVDAATHQAIGGLPTGKGVLGALIEHPQPLRLADVGRTRPATGSLLHILSCKASSVCPW